MSRFGADPQAFFNQVYQDTPPWEVGGPQPALARLFSDHPPQGPVLDVGCATGDLSLFLAGTGLEVLGVDFVESAVEQAAAKAAARSGFPTPSFLVADGLRPSLLDRKFNAVVDSGFFHLFNPEQGYDYLTEVASVLNPGGRLYLLAFAIEFPIAHAPRGVTQDELRGFFTAGRGWKLLELRVAEFQNKVAPVAAVACVAERL